MVGNRTALVSRTDKLSLAGAEQEFLTKIKDFPLIFQHSTAAEERWRSEAETHAQRTLLSWEIPEGRFTFWVRMCLHIDCGIWEDPPG